MSARNGNYDSTKDGVIQRRRSTTCTQRRHLESFPNSSRDLQFSKEAEQSALAHQLAPFKTFLDSITVTPQEEELIMELLSPLQYGSRENAPHDREDKELQCQIDIVEDKRAPSEFQQGTGIMDVGNYGSKAPLGILEEILNMDDVCHFWKRI